MDTYIITIVIGGVVFASPALGPVEARAVADAVLLTAPKLNPVILKVEA